MTAWRDTKKIIKGMPDLTEHQIQCGIIQEIRQHAQKIPALKWVHAIPNGAKLPYFEGKNDKRVCIQAAYLKAEGLTPGVVDICGPAPRGGYHGLYMECKSRTGKLTAEQTAFVEYAHGEGYYICLVRTIEDGVKQIMGYYQGLITKPEEDKT